MSGQERMFMDPVAYFDDDKAPTAENARTELDRLRAGVAEAEAIASKQTDWVERTRAEEHAKSLARELQSAEFNAKIVQSTPPRRAGQQAGGQPPPSPGYVLSDDGGSYLFVQNTKERKRAPRAAAVAVGTEQQYAEPTPYFETAKARRL